MSAHPIAADDSNVTLLVCSECGEGNYLFASEDSETAHCSECDHSVTLGDVDLEADERVSVTSWGQLGYEYIY